MSVTLLRANALALPLADASVDLAVTSPPYFGLRSYQDGGEHYAGQIGSEATPAEFVDALIAATAEMVRVLKPSGSIWVNLGDKYSERANGGPSVRRSGRGDNAETMPPAPNTIGVARAKSLLGIPWRYALRCIDDLGLILRAEVIWSKPNGLPESVTDRVRRSHEQWFHFTKEPRYFSAVDEIREAHAEISKRIEASARRAIDAGGGYSPLQRAKEVMPGRAGEEPQRGRPLNPLGRLPGSVWTIPTQSLTVPPDLEIDHFAAFPMEWPRRIIRGWSPSGICTACGEGRRPVVQSPGGSWHDHSNDHAMGVSQNGPARNRAYRERVRRGDVPRLIGETCACAEASAPTRPAVVLDPFGGTGTTALVADVLGRHGVSVDMSGDYCRLAAWRTSDPGERARARQVPKPEPVAPAQETLWEG